MPPQHRPCLEGSFTSTTTLFSISISLSLSLCVSALSLHFSHILSIYQRFADQGGNLPTASHRLPSKEDGVMLI